MDDIAPHEIAALRARLTFLEGLLLASMPAGERVSTVDLVLDAQLHRLAMVQKLEGGAVLRDEEVVSKIRIHLERQAMALRTLAESLDEVSR